MFSIGRNDQMHVGPHLIRDSISRGDGVDVKIDFTVDQEGLSSKYAFLVVIHGRPG